MMHPLEAFGITCYLSHVSESKDINAHLKVAIA